jgi:hypothetical protein
MNKRFRKPPLWVSCLVASLALHSVALYLFTKTPISMSGKSSSFFLSTKPLPMLLNEQTLQSDIENFLESFFEEFASSTPPTPSLKELAINTPPLLLETVNIELSIPKSEVEALARLQQEKKNPPPSIPVSSDQEEVISFEGTHKPIAPSASCMKPAPLIETPRNVLAFNENSINPPLTEDKIDLESSSILTFGLPSKKATSKGLPSIGVNSPPLLQEKKQDITPQNPFKDVPEEQLIIPTLQEESTSKYKQNISAYTTLASKSFAKIDDYLPTDFLFSLEWNGSFDIAPSFFPDGDGYVFSLKVTPKKELAEKHVKQTVLFLIDTSSQVEKHKVTVFKRSTLKALAALQPGDSFNIYLMDDETEKLSPYPVPFSLEGIRQAKEFLEKKFNKPLFASFDLFDGINEALDSIENSNEVYTAILLTSGKLSGSLASRQRALNNLIEKNAGKLSLFTAAVGKSNDLITLDMISSLSGGKLLYSDTNAAFPRKLTSFVKNLQSPLAKEIGISIHTSDPKADITISPLSMQTPNIYSKEPFVIMGRMKRLSPILLSLEGRNEEGWVLINKEINFEKAEEGNASLKKEWRQRQTANFYGQFLLDPKASYLLEAREILKASHGKACGE